MAWLDTSNKNNIENDNDCLAHVVVEVTVVSVLSIYFSAMHYCIKYSSLHDLFGCLNVSIMKAAYRLNHILQSNQADIA